jgi:hypothetical protein
MYSSKVSIKVRTKVKDGGLVADETKLQVSQLLIKATSGCETGNVIVLTPTPQKKVFISVSRLVNLQ